MKRKQGRLAGFAAVLLIAACLMTGCAKAGSDTESAEQTDKVKVVTSMFAAYDFARQIGGDKAEVSMLLKPGSESHTYEPTPRDIMDIEACDIFVYAGGENDTWVSGILESTESKKRSVLAMTACTDLLEEETVPGMEAEEEKEEESDEPEWDEHVWMSPKNAGRIVTALAQLYAEADPGNKEYYEDRLAAYLLKLDDIDARIREAVSKGARKELVFADRFPARYFTEEYGLSYSAAFPGCSENTEASASTVAFLIDEVKRDSIPVVCTIELSNGKLADTVAAETGAKVMTFYSAHNVTAQDFEDGTDYIALMERNLELIGEALAQ